MCLEASACASNVRMPGGCACVGQRCCRRGGLVGWESSLAGRFPSVNKKSAGCDAASRDHTHWRRQNANHMFDPCMHSQTGEYVHEQAKLPVHNQTKPRGPWSKSRIINFGPQWSSHNQTTVIAAGLHLSNPIKSGAHQTCRVPMRILLGSTRQV